MLRQRKVLPIPDETSQPQSSLSRRLASADLFPKPKEDYRRVQTDAGGMLSSIAAGLILTLVLWEVTMYIAGRDAYHTELSVDYGVTGRVPFNIDITFPSIPCHQLHIDAMDAAGGEENDVAHDLYKSPVDRHGHIVYHGRFNYVERRLGPDGHPVGPGKYDAKLDPKSPHFCGKCYIEPNTHHHGYDKKGGVVDEHFAKKHGEACCNTCEEVMKMYDLHRVPRPHVNEVEQCITELSQANPGCNLRGALHLRRVKGNFHFAPGSTTIFGPFGQHIHQFGMEDVARFNASHIINHFTIGDDSIQRFSRNGVSQPLNGVSYGVHRGLGQARYFIKIVPSTYTVGRRSTTDLEAEVPDVSYEYSVQRYHTEFPMMGMMGKIPSVFFVFDFHPIQINNIFARPPLGRFLVKLCGIVGGLFVVMELLDRVISGLRLVGQS